MNAPELRLLHFRIRVTVTRHYRTVHDTTDRGIEVMCCCRPCLNTINKCAIA